MFPCNGSETVHQQQCYLGLLVWSTIITVRRLQSSSQQQLMTNCRNAVTGRHLELIGDCSPTWGIQSEQSVTLGLCRLPAGTFIRRAIRER